MTAADDAVDVTRRLLSPVHALLSGAAHEATSAAPAAASAVRDSAEPDRPRRPASCTHLGRVLNLDLALG